MLQPHEVHQLSEAGYSCFCSRELELSNPAYSNAYAAFLALSAGTSTDPISALAALRVALVALMGPSGLCSSQCRSALAAVIEVGASRSQASAVPVRRGGGSISCTGQLSGSGAAMASGSLPP